MPSVADVLPQIFGKDIYIYLNKENPDRTKKDLDLIIHFEGKKVVVPLLNEKEVLYLASSLHHFVSSSSIVVSWFAKDIFSYLKSRTGIDLEINNVIYDLSIISSYFGSKNSRPNNLKDAFYIFKKFIREPDWKIYLKYYKQIYYPLLSKVLPNIENNCIIDNNKKICVYPTYVLEGQANGRLKTVKINSHSYNPHSIGVNEKISLRPRDYGDVFVYFDYKNMEVNVLQWLSGDKELLDIINSGKDLYKEIWKKISKQEPTDNHRNICKNIFLPVVFGMGPKKLSEKIRVPEKIASKIIDSLFESFPVAFNWVKSQKPVSNNIATDVFGRKREFDDHERYKIKNFCIQSPASMICLKKLVRLQEVLENKYNICFHIHDGYCVICKKNEVEYVSKIGIEVLEEEDNLFPDLKLNVTCNFGHSLNNLQSLKEKEVLS
jgi:hypothetical protein